MNAQQIHQNVQMQTKDVQTIQEHIAAIASVHDNNLLKMSQRVLVCSYQN
jgi:hypothetical protein